MKDFNYLNHNECLTLLLDLGITYENLADLLKICVENCLNFYKVVELMYDLMTISGNNLNFQDIDISKLWESKLNVFNSILEFKS